MFDIMGFFIGSIIENKVFRKFKENKNYKIVMVCNHKRM